jgi:hypothetical protein
MKTLTRPAPGTIRLTLFCLAFLALAWWAGTAGGTVGIPDTVRSSHTEEIYEGGYVKGTVGGREAIGTLWNHGGMPDFRPLAVKDLTGDWHIYQDATADSLAARVERLEARQGWNGWVNTLGHWTCILLILLLAVFLGHHSNKHWKDAHKP